MHMENKFNWSCLQKYELDSRQVGSNWKRLLLLLLWIPKQQVSTDPRAIYNEDVARKIRQKKYKDCWIDKHVKGQNSAVLDVSLPVGRKWPSQAFQLQKVCSRIVPLLNYISYYEDVS